jgi:3-oxoacyl-[acyl-carrier-protein] synthase-3
MSYGIGILATSQYLSSKINTNEEMCDSIPELTEDWIIQKTGIKQRYYCNQFESTEQMAIMVTKRLLLFNNIESDDIGLIIITSFSQVYMFPPLSVRVHASIKAPKDCQVIDINVNCVGLVTGTTIAVERMKADHRIKYALVIGTEVLSRYVDKTDRFTAPFFSDGASGVLLGRVDIDHGLLNSKFCTDSSVYDEVKLERGGYIYQNGKATWTQAITNLPYVLKELVHSSHLAMKDIDFFIFHQANKVLIDYIMDKHRIPREKTYTNVEEIGNTGAASIGIALDDAMNKKLIKKGDLVVLAGIGAGFNFGANLWKM